MEKLKPARQHGPAKEKTQISTRIRTKLKDAIDAQMEDDGTRITDIIERGLVLALAERNRKLPVWNTEVRFMVANASKTQTGLIRGLLIAMALEDLGLSSSTPESELDEKIFGMVCWFLEWCNRLAEAPALLERYSGCGKSPEEMAELAQLASHYKD